MVSLLPLAFAAGVLTIAAPCLLPVLPAILGGSLGTSKWRPFGIVAGLVTTFTIFGTAFAIFLDVLGISKGTLRTISIVLLFLFGVALAMPALYEWALTKGTLLWKKVSATKACCVPQNDVIARSETTKQSDGQGEEIATAAHGGLAMTGRGSGFWGAFGIGAALGAIWTPCAGPIFGAILTLAATTQSIVRSGVLFFFYASGAGIPMLLIGYGSRALVMRIKGLARVSYRIRQVAGVILMIWAVALYFGVDRYVQANLAPFLPQPKL